MKILAIETSCDETAAAIVEDGTRVLSNVIASQIALHDVTGGVVPEVAAREHVVKIMPVVEQALKDARILLEDVDAIAVTQGPGLLSSLVIGVTAGATLALAMGKPLIPVNHISGHIYANWLDLDATDEIWFPVMVLTVSGGHNELVYMKSHGDFKLIGETLDDAAGEAFDKVARILGLGYPGGPHISRVGESGNAQKIKFPRAMMGKTSYDFSFSGLKTAVLNTVKEEFAREGKLSPEFVADCAASFQEAVCDVLVSKLLKAAKEFNVKEVHLAGGVSANRRLREIINEKIGETRLRYAKNIVYCTDNAAMIGAAAYFCGEKGLVDIGKSGSRAALALADPNLRMYHDG